MKITINEVPNTCKECIFYREFEYHCHSERGTESSCKAGFMNGSDMRDRVFREFRFGGCELEEGKEIDI